MSAHSVVNELPAKILPQLLVPGPKATFLRFTNPTQGLYRKVEVLHTGTPPILLDLQGGVDDATALAAGVDAESRNTLVEYKLKQDLPWSLKVWSLDGKYAVLTTYLESNGIVDVRNTESLQAYDTSTGELAPFSSKTNILAADSFVKWSADKLDVALLRGKGSAVEEAYPKI